MISYGIISVFLLKAFRHPMGDGQDHLKLRCLMPSSLYVHCSILLFEYQMSCGRYPLHYYTVPLLHSLRQEKFLKNERLCFLSDFYDFKLNPPKTTDIIHITPNDFYCTHSGFYHVSVPCASQKVLPNHCNNDAGAAHAHSNFGRRNNENYLSTTETPSIRNLS